MRIIGGKYRGRVLHPPKGLPVRPTTDQAKEGLFNILHHHYTLQDACVLELFAGTGNVSYEFISRGAASLTAVDQHPACVRYISQTFKDLNFPQGTATCAPAEKFIAKAIPDYDFIFLDPPYAWTGVSDLVETVFSRQLLAPAGLLIVEHATGADYSHLRYLSEVRKYGSSSFSLFEWPDPDS